jgi:outer membrane protein assembly factor BamE
MIQAPPASPASKHLSLSHRLLLAAACLAALLLAGTTGCVYRMTVQQGNFLDPKQVAQLQAGMTRSQVRFLLGTPMLPDAFDRDRWDYLYYEKIGRLKKADQRRLTVFFEDDKVARFENVGTPLATPVTPEEPPAEPAVPPAVTPPMPTPLPAGEPGSSPAT